MKMLRLLGALLALFACARANEFYVDAGATAPGDGTAASPFPTIQQGVNAVVNFRGDRVLIQRGTYREGVNLSGRKQFSLIGVGTATIEARALGWRSTRPPISRWKTSCSGSAPTASTTALRTP